ncbi:AAEL017006-PA [Aedes aegypti]|uniref:AAEL017006-PA n=1 Tax=Aedes aegypti TaxID=7159 RepID=J9EBR8_AEDAE|nr:AAEL017006-PA [Aedes aegypti]
MAVQDPEVTSRGISARLCTTTPCATARKWNFLWQRYLKSNVGSEKVMIIGALSCIREIWLVERFLLWSLKNTSSVRKQDTTIVFGGVTKSDVGFHLANSFFLENVEEIYNNISPDTSRVSRFIEPLAELMSSMKELQELKDLVESKRTVFEKATQGVKQALKTVEINLQWKLHGYTQMILVAVELPVRKSRCDGAAGLIRRCPRVGLSRVFVFF